MSIKIIEAECFLKEKMHVMLTKFTSLIRYSNTPILSKVDEILNRFNVIKHFIFLKEKMIAILNRLTSMNRY